jgi:hypothetical protein
LAGVGAIKSQGHWEANDIVQHYQNPLRDNTLAPIVAQVNSGQLPPEQGVAQIKAAWAKYLSDVNAWAGTAPGTTTVQHTKGGGTINVNSDRGQARDQSIATLTPIVKKIIEDMGGTL